MKNSSRNVVIGMALFLFVSLITLQAIAQEPTGTETFQARVWIPLVMTDNNDIGPSPSNITSDTWPMYYSPQLHVTFAYPTDWHIEPPFIIEKITPPDEALVDDTLEYDMPEEGTYSIEGYVVGILPPASHSDQVGKIEMTIQSYEIEEGQSLLDWQNEMIALLNLAGPERGAIIDLVDLTNEDLRNETGADQILHGITVVESVGSVSQTIWLAKGRLVYIINTLVSSKEMEDVLRQVALSVQFDPDLPDNLNALYGRNIERRTIEDSINLFLQDEGQIECDIVCRDAEAAERLVPNPDPIPTATPDSVRSASANAIAVGTQKALPPYWEAPVYVANDKNVECGSPLHTQ
jgi:hypothetical protein